MVLSRYLCGASVLRDQDKNIKVRLGQVEQLLLCILMRKA